MSEGSSPYFVRQEQQRVAEEFKGPNHLLKNPAYKRFVREFTSEDPGDYEDGKKANGQSGVAVPVSNRRGMIQGNPNPYGKIIIGNVCSGEDLSQRAPLQIQVLEDRVQERAHQMQTHMEKTGQVQPQPQLPKSSSGKVTLPNTVEELEAVLPILEGATLKLAIHKLRKCIAKESGDDEQVEMLEQSAEFQRELGDLMNEMESEEMQVVEAGDTLVREEEMPVAQEESPVQQPQTLSYKQQAPQPAPQPQPAPVSGRPLFGEPVRVTMSGEFGRSSVRFLNIERHDNQLVLIYDPEENIFIPATGDKAFNLSFNNETIQVQSVGIEFGLDFLGVGVLVFLIIGA